MRSPLQTLHMPISSEDPEAKYSPFGENTILFTSERWLTIKLILSPLYTFHTLIILYLDADAKYSPLYENTTVFTPTKGA